LGCPDGRPKFIFAPFEGGKVLWNAIRKQTELQKKNMFFIIKFSHPDLALNSVYCHSVMLVFGPRNKRETAIYQCLLDVYYHICLSVLFMCLHTFICVYIHIYLYIYIYIYIYERGRERLGPRVGLASYMLRWPGCAAWGPAGLPGWLPKS
jgi:hypothetical protein